ncbi:MAG TPA: ABC transporter ATP-binding protein [Acidimicrobiales bacterium]|nr:ABC transporter ATP-binding protein [Acidimicrobiales bacterium]
MAWGGGGGWGGGGFGGGGGGWGGGQAGLPFAGVPPEMQAGVDALQAKEPAADLRDVPFSYVAVSDDHTFSLKTFLRPKLAPIVGILVLVALEVVAQQIGPRLTQQALDKGVALKDYSVVLRLGLIYIGAVIIGAVITSLRTSWSGSVGEDLLYGLRIRIFSHIQKLSLDFFTAEKAGRIMTRVTSDVEALQTLFQQGLVNMLIQVGTLVFVVTQLFSMNAQLATWVVFGVLPMLIGLTWWFRTQSDIGYLAVRDWIAAVLADLQENLSGMRIVTAHNRQRYNAVKHRNVISEYRRSNLYTAHIGGVYGPGTQLVGVLAQGMVLLIGGNMVLSDQLTIGELTAFVLYLSAFFQPIQQLAQLYNVYQQGRAATTKIRELFASVPSVEETPDAAELPPIDGEMILEGVTFGYSARTPVLRDVDLRIRSGETFALVGPTGAGKSTIAKLLTRFYDPVKGRVLVDGHDIRGVTLASLRRQLGIVPQEAFLFAGTIGENISFATPSATREEVLAACDAVGIRDMIEALPNGIDTPCHERGVTLSSGQRQLIALARAFLASPRVLVLDEATSSLDLGTEALVERALDVLLEGRTAVLIAHRLNTAMRADRIGVVEGGRLVEVGPHDELLARGGAYARMYGAWAQSATSHSAVHAS